MSNLDADAIGKISIIIIAYGIAGVLFFGFSIPYLYAFDYDPSAAFSSSLDDEFKAMSATMDDASLAAKNAAESVRRSRDALKSAADSEKSIQKTLSDTSAALDAGSQISGEVSILLGAVHENIRILGVNQFKDLAVSFNSISHQLGNASENIQETAHHISVVSEKVDDTADGLGENALDMEKLSEDFQIMGDKMDGVAEKTREAASQASSIKKLMVIVSTYLISLHAVITLCGVLLYSSRQMKQ